MKSKPPPSLRAPAKHRQVEPVLPKGLTPVLAGRYGRWLLGFQAQQRASKRRPEIAACNGSLVERAIHLFTPWQIEAYPGTLRFLSKILGIGTGTAKGYLYSPDHIPFPAHHAETLARLLFDRAATCQALAEELSRYAIDRRTAMPTGWRGPRSSRHSRPPEIL